MDSTAPLNAKQDFLASNAETGYKSAAQLLAWWKENDRTGALPRKSLAPSYAPPFEYFFGEMTLDGRDTTAMGCFWKSRHQSRQSGSAAQCTLNSFLHEQFMQRCRWKNPDGLPGGFEFIPQVFKRSSDRIYGAFPPDGSLNLGEVGKQYEWVVLEAVVNDFFRNMPGPRMGPRMLSRMPVMASYILAHKDYFVSLHPPVPGSVAECSFGYSFLPCAVNKSIFGYGPGQFKAAVKQFRMILLESGEIEIQMSFLVSPRSQKILSLGGFDPVYGMVHALNLLTLDILKLKRRAHDWLDIFQLATHAKIYQALLDGMRDSWETTHWAGKAEPIPEAGETTPDS